MHRSVLGLLFSAVLLAPAAPAQRRAAAPPRPAARRPVPRPPGTYVRLRTSAGDVLLRMLPQEAPQTVANFVGLAEGAKAFREWRPGPQQGKMVKRPFYEGLTFHRVLKNFMIQGGCPMGDGTGGPGYTLPDELPPRRPYVRGSVLMSRGDRPNSGGSQFFILQADVRRHLTKQYPVFATVVEGLDVLDRIANAETRPNRLRPTERSTPVNPVVIRQAVVTRIRVRR